MKDVLVQLIEWLYLLFLSELQTRLRNGTSDSSSSGLVEVRRGNATEWGAVCTKELTPNEANVACRSLGYRWGKVGCANLQDSGFY